MGYSIPTKIIKEFLPYLTKEPEKAISQLETLGQAFQYNVNATRVYLKLLQEGPDAATKFARGQALINQRLWEMQNVERGVLAMMGPTGVAIRDLSKTVFWLGLGSMFAAMSFSRLQARQTAAISSSLSYQRSLMSLIEAEDNLNELRERGITSGREYARAVLNLREAQFAEEVATRRLTDAYIQQRFAAFQLAAGTLPTVIRTMEDMWLFMNKLIFAKNQNIIADVVADFMARKYNQALARQIVLVNGATVSFGALAGAVTAAAVALPLLIGLFTYLAAKRQAEERIKNMRQEIEGLHAAMTTPGSPTFLESLDITAKTLDKINKGPGINVGLRTGSSVVVSITGPITIHSEQDIDAIANRIAQKTMLRMRSGGGYIS